MLVVLVMLWLGALAVSSTVYVVVVLSQGVAAAVRRSPARPHAGARTGALSGGAAPQHRPA